MYLALFDTENKQKQRGDSGIGGVRFVSARLMGRERSARIASMYSAVIKLSNENVRASLSFHG